MASDENMQWIYILSAFDIIGAFEGAAMRSWNTLTIALAEVTVCCAMYLYLKYMVSERQWVQLAFTKIECAR